MRAPTIAPRYASLRTPLGQAWYAYTPDGVALLSVARSERAFVEEAARALGVRPVRHDPPESFARRVRHALESGDGSCVDWTRMQPFQASVLRAASAIPAGRFETYAGLARAIGNPGAVRAVGTALARNPVPLLVPCHRVVRSDGNLGNYGLGGEPTKRALLEREGALTRTSRRRTAAGAATAGRSGRSGSSGLRGTAARRPLARTGS